jgi:hypothetical protein
MEQNEFIAAAARTLCAGARERTAKKSLLMAGRLVQRLEEAGLASWIEGSARNEFIGRAAAELLASRGTGARTAVRAAERLAVTLEKAGVAPWTVSSRPKPAKPEAPKKAPAKPGEAEV